MQDIISWHSRRWRQAIFRSVAIIKSPFVKLLKQDKPVQRHLLTKPHKQSIALSQAN